MMNPMAAAAAAAAAVVSSNGYGNGPSNPSCFMSMASGSNSSTYTFNCSECSLTKNSVEDLEVFFF